MQFNSIPFLFYFLPCFLTVYYIAPARWKNCVLVLGSLVFYTLLAGGRLWWTALLAGLTLLTFFLARTLQKSGGKWALGCALGAMAALLVFFKLWDGGRWLPGGMSFFLFQMAAYLIDVFRRRLPAERDLIAYGAQTVMFPKLLSGPLAAPEQLRIQCRDRTVCARDFHRGLQTLILGLGLKVLLADRLGGLWSQAGVAGYENISTPFAWLALAAFSLRLYFDFWGYSLMAVGLGRMLGFRLPENFRDPYSARSVSDFYRRWHITLGAWFREYIYIPLGGSRKGTGRTVLNLCAVWLLTGFWHGTGGNYLVWAGFLCLLIVNERLWLGKLLNRSRVWSHIYLVFVILLSWLPFALGDWGQLAVYSGKLFGLGGAALNGRDYLIWGGQYSGLIAAGIVLATPFPGRLWRRIQDKPWADVLLFALFWVCVYFIAASSQDPFMYFQY